MYTKKHGTSIETIRPTKTRRIFVSFIEEYWAHQVEGTTLGRVEVERLGDRYPSEEIRWGCQATDEFYAFRDKWDFKYVSEKELSKIRNEIKKKFAPELWIKKEKNPMKIEK